MSSLPKTVTRQRRDYDLNPGPSAPESSTLTTQLPSHPINYTRIYTCIHNYIESNLPKVDTRDQVPLLSI